MTRANYSQDYTPLSNLYRANVNRAIAGAAGQKFFKELVAALEALPNQRLIADQLEDGGEVCALGALGRARGLQNLDALDLEDTATLAKLFGVPECLAREVVYENDEGLNFACETPANRFRRMLAWARDCIGVPQPRTVKRTSEAPSGPSVAAGEP